MAAIRGFNLAKITKINLEFSCFDNSVKSARDFFNRITSSRMKSTNPKCQITTTIKGDYSPPNLQVTFSDKSEMQFNPSDHEVLSIIAAINTKSHSIIS